MSPWLLQNALSPYKEYCDGYGAPGAVGNLYITLPTLSVAKAPILLPGETRPGLIDEILAFDRAESLQDGAYLGQINAITVSSFCGIQGRVWGLEIFPATGLRKPHQLVSSVDGVPVYDAQPVIDASRDLLGTVGAKNFPLIPGAHVPCAMHSIEKKGSADHIYAAFAIGIPTDRATQACLFMEDVGSLAFHNEIDSSKARTEQAAIMRKLALSVLEVGKNQHIEYAEIHVAFKSISFGYNEAGCALVAIPYITLAQGASDKQTLANFATMSLDDWKSRHSALI